LGDGSPKDNAAALCVAVKNDLPSCMHLISSNEVIRRVETYFDGRVLKYLSPSQAAAGRRAVQQTAFNPIDDQPLTLANARYASERFYRRIPECPTHFNGRGIVICVGGLADFARGWVCLKMLRQLSCALPVELWHWGCQERITEMEGLLRPLTVRCVALAEFSKQRANLSFNAGEVAAYTISHSAFQEVLLLDPATVPAANPDYLFEQAGYQEGGAMVWLDTPGRKIEPQAWHLCGLSPSWKSPMANAPLLVDKKKCWKALALWQWYHEKAEVYYPHTHDGKDAAHLAFCKAGIRYVRAPRSGGRGLCLCDVKGRLVFQKSRTDSWSLFLNTPGQRAFRWEKDCRQHLEELRRHLDVELSRPSAFSGVCKRSKSSTEGELPWHGTGRSKKDGVFGPLTLVTLHDERMQGPGKITAGALREYAQRQGYGFVYHDRLLDQKRHASWNKILAVRDALMKQRAGWAMWVDADAMVMNQRIRAESLIPSGCDLVLASDANGLVAGIFMIRYCEWSLKFLDTVLFLGDVKHNPDGYGPKWEQNTIKHILKNFVGFEEHAVLLPKRRLNSDLNSFEPGDFILHLGLLTNGNRERIFREALAWVVR
jgi:hypothetical protein